MKTVRLSKPGQYSKIFLLAITITVWVFGWVCLKISLPVLIQIPITFSISPSTAAYSVTIFIVCFALFQPIWGHLSERYGRRAIMLAGLAITVLGCIISAWSGSFALYMLGRALEGSGIAISSPIGRSILVDVLDKKELVGTIAIATILCAIQPFFAPMIGYHISSWLGWRFVFILLAITSLILFLGSMFLLPETHQHRKKETTLLTTLRIYLMLLRDKAFFGYMLSYQFLNCSFIAYYTALPFWMVHQLNIPEQYYVYLSAFPVACYVCSILLSKKLSSKWSNEKIIQYIVVLFFFFLIIMIPFSVMQPLTVMRLMVIICCHALIAGAMSAQSNAVLMDRVRAYAGVASGLISTMLYLTLALLSTIAMHISLKHHGALGWYLASVGVITLASYYYGIGGVLK